MKPHAPLLGLLAALALPRLGLRPPRDHRRQPADRPGDGFDDKTLDAVNVPERVLLSDHEGTYDVYFKAGGPNAVNEALRRFAALPGRDREIVLLPVPAPPLVFGKDPFALRLACCTCRSRTPAAGPAGGGLRREDHADRLHPEPAAAGPGRPEGGPPVDRRPGAATTSRPARRRPRSWPPSARRRRPSSARRSRPARRPRPATGWRSCWPA